MSSDNMEQKSDKRGRIVCRQCGYGIVHVAYFQRDYQAQRRGFCGWGCLEVWKQLKELTLRYGSQPK